MKKFVATLMSTLLMISGVNLVAQEENDINNTITGIETTETTTAPSLGAPGAATATSASAVGMGSGVGVGSSIFIGSAILAGVALIASQSSSHAHSHAH